ncbi:auxin response factor 4-like protein [Tanacetum coccineum]
MDGGITAVAAVVAALTATISASSGHRKDEFNMKFCIDESPQQRFIGVVTGVGDMDPYEWSNSKRRCLMVRWDEAIETSKITNQHQDSSRIKVSEPGDGVTIYTRCRHISSSDDVTTSLDDANPHRLNSDLEDSTL